jgi:paired amphipathic helix protein Sin3a
LDEFKQFLPDTTGDQQTAAIPAEKPRGIKRPVVKKDAIVDGGSAKKAKATSRAKTVDDKTKVSRIRAVLQSWLIMSLALQPKRGKNDARDSRKAALAEPQYVETPLPLPSEAPYYSVYASQAPHPGYAYEPPPPPPVPLPILHPKPHASAHDIAFFSRLKTFLNDTPTYHEFLKLLNLFTQEILDLTSLVSRAYLFIGQDATLWKEFTEIVGWTDGMALGEAGGRVEIVNGERIVENVPRINDIGMNGKGDSGKGKKTYGPSYRQLPQSVGFLSRSPLHFLSSRSGVNRKSH